jgi:hypothetical protein
VFSPKALSLRLTVCSFGKVSSDVRRWESACGISLRSRPVNISARFAIYPKSRSAQALVYASIVWRWDHTCNNFLVSRTSPSTLQASTPKVFPSNRISSTSSISLRALICTSTSFFVSSFNPFPSSEKIFVFGAIFAKCGVFSEVVEFSRVNLVYGCWRN